MRKGDRAAVSENNKELLKRGLILFFSVLMLVYIVYQVYMITHDPVDTEVVRTTTINDSVDTEVFVVRSEEYIKTKKNGTIISLVSDGSRVAQGEGVAAIFTDTEDAANYARLKNIEAELTRYNRLNSQSSSYAVNVSTMNRTIAEEIITMVEAIDDGDVATAQEDIYNVRDKIITRQIATGEPVDLDAKIASLNHEYQTLQQKSSKHNALTAQHSGYYISGSDGFETTVDYSKVKDMTVKDVQKALKASARKVPDSVIGKVCNDFDWYMICVIPSNHAGDLVVGDSVSVNMPYSAVSSVPAKVAAINNEQNEKKCAVILCSNRMNSFIAALRKEKAELVIDSYTGLKVSVKAIRVNEKGEQGVFIKEGNIARFKKLDTIFTNDKYVISKPHETGNYVSLYDNVILGGKDLYDGKIIR